MGLSSFYFLKFVDCIRQFDYVRHAVAVKNAGWFGLEDVLPPRPIPF